MKPVSLVERQLPSVSEVDGEQEVWKLNNK